MNEFFPETPEEKAKFWEGVILPMRRAVYPNMIVDKIFYIVPEGCLEVKDEVSFE